jgi:hypothetical protein
MNLEVNLGGIRLANPVVMAWGRYAVVKLRRGRGHPSPAVGVPAMGRRVPPGPGGGPCQDYHGMIEM